MLPERVTRIESTKFVGASHPNWQFHYKAACQPSLEHHNHRASQPTWEHYQQRASHTALAHHTVVASHPKRAHQHDANEPPNRKSPTKSSEWNRMSGGHQVGRVSQHPAACQRWQSTSHYREPYIQTQSASQRSWEHHAIQTSHASW